MNRSIINKVVTKPWGEYQILDSGPFYVTKKICIKEGHRISLQSHGNRIEHWTIVSDGQYVIQTGNECIYSTEKQYKWNLRPIFINRETIHRAEALVGDLIIIETQLGDCSEEDIIRYHDDYKR